MRVPNWPRARAALAIPLAVAPLVFLASCGGDDNTVAPPPPEPEGLRLHVPSPDWQDQIIYFLMTDRFDDGDPSNNNQGAGEYDPAVNAKYSGGDLAGVTRRVEYIRNLGATAVWITPPVANQWWDPLLQYGGYHGYWAENFMEVDKHVGTLDDYKRLSDTLHRAGMYLVQDVVVNHMGNFFTYGSGWSATDPAASFQLNTQSAPRSAPSQAPFDMNDPRDASFRDAAIYHWTPPISNYQDRDQYTQYQLSDLDDLNTENPVVQEALRKSYAHWIREVGVDAFRIDTALHVRPAFFKDFMSNTDTKAPGMFAAAKATGRNGFLAFGEGFTTDRPYEDTNTRELDSYMVDPATGEDILPSMINFPLYGTATDVFARGRPTAELSYRIAKTMSLHRRPHQMPSFIDNHDVNRFLVDGSSAGLKQGLLMLMTLPGVPVIYYGTEQSFTEQRGAMFAAGFQSGGADRFDTSSPMYRYIQSATGLRKANRVFTRGTPTVLKDNAAGPGVLAYGMAHEAARAIVVFNTADQDTLLDNLPTGLPAGTVLKNAFAIDGAGQDLTVGADGTVTLKLAARAGFAWVASSQTATPPVASRTLAITPLAALNQTGDFTLAGTAGTTAPFQLVIDGDVTHAVTVTPAAGGAWSAVVDTGTMIDPAVRHTAVAYDAASGAVSASVPFHVVRDWTLLTAVTDPAGDDTGPTGAYQYPTDSSWGANRQLDLRKVTVSGAGGAMKIDVQTNQITSTWNPQNGFDHVAFTIFVQVPGRTGGATVMPQQNASVPGGMAWHYRIRAHGWSNALFSAAGASATQEGTSAAPAPAISVDRVTQTVTFILTDSALGKPTSLAGAKVYVTTWDYDGGYRGLNPAAQAYAFGGGDGATSPLVMDDVLITLP